MNHPFIPHWVKLKRPPVRRGWSRSAAKTPIWQVKELATRTILDCCTAEDERSRHAAVLSFNLLLERGRLGPSDFEWLSQGETTRMPPDIAELLALDQEE